MLTGFADCFASLILPVSSQTYLDSSHCHITAHKVSPTFEFLWLKEKNLFMWHWTSFWLSLGMFKLWKCLCLLLLQQRCNIFGDFSSRPVIQATNWQARHHLNEIDREIGTQHVVEIKWAEKSSKVIRRKETWKIVQIWAGFESRPWLLRLIPLVALSTVARRSTRK